MSMLMAINLQNRILCVCDTRISIMKPKGGYEPPYDHFCKYLNLSSNVIFMGAGSVRLNCHLAPILKDLCGKGGQIQDLLELLDEDTLRRLVTDIQKKENIYGDSVSFILASLDASKPQEFSAASIVKRLSEAGKYIDGDELHLDEEIMKQLKSLGAKLEDGDIDLSKVATDAKISMPGLPKTVVTRFDVFTYPAHQARVASIKQTYYSPFEVCIVAPSKDIQDDELASEAVYAVELTDAKDAKLVGMLDKDAIRLHKRFKLLAQKKKIEEVVNGGMTFLDITPKGILGAAGKVYRQVGASVEVVSDTKIVKDQLYIFSVTDGKYVRMRRYDDPFKPEDYMHGLALA